MKANVFVNTPFLVVSSLILAIENAQPLVQAAQPMPIGRYPAITALPRNVQPVDHWEHRAIIIGGTDSAAESPTSPAGPTSTTSIETTSSSSTTSTTSTSDPPTSTTSSSSSSSIVRSSSSSSPSVTGVVSTASNGGVTTVIQTVTNSGTATSSSASATSTDASDNSGVGGKSIAGIVVVAVLVVVGIGGFIWWKLSKKRFSGLDDTDDNFKWPDLQDNTTAMQPLPGRAESVRGAATDASHSEHAKPYYDNQSAMSSAADLTRGPVEHNSAYYDAPPPHPAYGHNAYGATGDNASGYYDPYSGPVPEAFSPQVTSGPSFAAEQGRQASPGPNAAYDAYGQRAASPGPNAAYARAGSPGPNVAYGGPRAASPGPNVAYGAPRAASPGPNAAYRTASPAPGYAPYGGRAASPGPNNAYGGGRASPGPNMAYGGRTSPGPNNAYGGHQF